MSTDTVHPSVTIATGSESGVYHALGLSLKRVLENSAAFDKITVQATDGSAENMRLIGESDPEVHLAFVQGDASPSTNARLVTTLYDEFLHILVTRSQAEHIRTIYDLEGKRISLGPSGSGTRELASRVLEHFGVQPAEDLLLSPEQKGRRLQDGSIDAAFMLTAIPSGLIAELARQDAIRFLSLGDTQTTGNVAHNIRENYDPASAMIQSRLEGCRSEADANSN